MLLVGDGQPHPTARPLRRARTPDILSGSKERFGSLLPGRPGYRGWQDEHVSSDPPIRIVVADDHPVVRGGLVAMLRTIPGLDVVGEASDGEAAVLD